MRAPLLPVTRKEARGDCRKTCGARGGVVRWVVLGLDCDRGGTRRATVCLPAVRMDWDSESRGTTEEWRQPGADGEAGTLRRPGAEEEEEAGTLRKEMNRSVHLRSREDRGEAPSKTSRWTQNREEGLVIHTSLGVMNIHEEHSSMR